MARKPIQIDVASDTRAFSKGVKDGVIKPLDGVEDALDGVSKTSDRTSGDLARDARETGRKFDDLAQDTERAFDKVDGAARDAGGGLDDLGTDAKSAGDDMERAMRDAQTATEKTEDDVDSLKKAIQQAGKKSFKDFGDDADKGMSRAQEGVGEFKEEAKANFSEVASSFTGDMDSAVDGIQGTLGGLASSIPGGVGLALAGVGAAGGAAYALWKKNSEKIEQRISDMFDDMTQSGEDYLSNEYLTQAITDIISGAEGAATSLEHVNDIAARLDIPVSTVLAAYAGDADSMADAVEAVDGKLADVKRTIKEVEDAGSFVGDNSELRKREVALEGIAAEWGGVSTATDAAKSKVVLYEETKQKIDTGSALKSEATRMENIGKKINANTDASKRYLFQAKKQPPDIVQKVSLDIRPSGLRQSVQNILNEPFSVRVTPRDSNIRNGKYLP